MSEESDDERKALIKRKCELLENALTQSLTEREQFGLIENQRSLNEELLPLMHADSEQTAHAARLMACHGARIKALLPEARILHSGPAKVD